jgi:hypothetical protein
MCKGSATKALLFFKGMQDAAAMRGERQKKDAQVQGLAHSTNQNEREALLMGQVA